METLNKLIHLTKSSTLRTLSGEPKRLYKNAVSATFFNIIVGRHLQVGQYENITITQDILSNPKKSLKKYPIINFKEKVQKSLHSGYFHNPEDPETIDKIFEFFREKLVSLKRGKRFWKASEFQHLFILDDFFKNSYGPIKEHHWIDFNIEQGLVPTIPEFITYGDLIHSWNFLLERCENFIVLTNKTSDTISDMDFIKSEQSREIQYEIFTLQRICFTSCVTFVESYLYYLYYNFKVNNQFIDDVDISSLYSMKERKVNDTKIIEKIIIPKFINSSDQAVEKDFHKLYKKHKKINDVRNSIIHTSAFEDKANQSSYMELFFENNLDEVEEAMRLSVEFVLLIEKTLPDKDKILFWWDKFKYPNFGSREKLTIVNPQSNLSKLESF